MEEPFMVRRLVSVSALLCILAVGLWAADDPAIGTWKLNSAKSKLTTVRNQTMKLESAPDGHKVAVDVEDVTGMKNHIESTIKYDGKDYPVQGSPLWDTLSAKHVD